MKGEPVSSSFIFLSFSTSDGSVDAETLRRRQGGAAPHPRRRELHRHGVRRARWVDMKRELWLRHTNAKMSEKSTSSGIDEHYRVTHLDGYNLLLT